MVKFYFPLPINNQSKIYEILIFFINFQVFRVILHENFNYKLGLDNDIALLKLKTEVTFTDYVQPSCLWTEKIHERSPTKEIIGTVSKYIDLQKIAGFDAFRHFFPVNLKTKVIKEIIKRTKMSF